MVSKALVVGAYQRKAEEIARLGVELTVLTPPSWRDARGEQTVQPCHTQGYDFRVIPLRLNGNFHLHFYPSLASQLAELRPQLVHMDEEPYNLATWLGLRAASRCGAVGLFFTWQNLERRYPPPFRWLEQANYQRVPLAIAGNQAAATVLGRKGYRGEIAVIPQFGVDPLIFSPPRREPGANALRIGYAGGLLPEKGVDLLLRACAALHGDWSLAIAGAGKEEKALRQLARDLGIHPRVAWPGKLASSAMPAFYQAIDVLVLPSRTTPNWMEQFGRVLVEAMACEATVIGSRSGEIPNVVGEVGLLFAEDNWPELRSRLQHLLDHPTECLARGQAGRQRVLEHYTMTSVARRTVDAYRRALGE